MKLKKFVMCAAIVALLPSIPASAQVAADLVAGPGIGGPGPEAPHTPAGMVVIGSNVWFGDAAQGFRHYIPVDPNNIDPLNTGTLQFDINTEFSIGGGSCFLWCSVGQTAQDGSARAYLAVYDHPKGQPFNPGGGGVWKVEFQPAFGNFGAFAGLSPVAFTLGLSGDLPTAVALGPDGKLYVGFLKSGNVKRVTNPSVENPSSTNQTVESVGGTFQGRNMRAMAFLGPDLYLATDQGLDVIRNVANCINNSGGCGNAVRVQDGFSGSAHVGLTTDAAGKVYFSLGPAGTVYRYTPLDGRVVPVSNGFLFVDGHTNALSLDPFGNLWVGDDPSDGAFNFSGRLWRIPASRVASIP
ncbi:MAG TPA: hypothetical protein VKB88_30660 [Bryobacteraceae bacterium]|nr:hypothetical protein [Bryobacteraceae bacterium]